MSISLCYDKERDRLFTIPCETSDALFVSHEKKGFSYNTFSLIDNFLIKIASNFGYGNASFLYFQAKYRDIPLINSYNWSHSLNCQITHFELEPTTDNWECLFNNINEVYNNRDSWNNNSAIEAISNLKTMFLSESFNCICKHIWSKKTHSINKEHFMFLLVKKTTELIDVLETIKLEKYKHIKEEMIPISKKAIQIIHNLYTSKYSDMIKVGISAKPVLNKQLRDLEEYYDTIYKYYKRVNQLNVIFIGE